MSRGHGKTQRQKTKASTKRRIFAELDDYRNHQRIIYEGVDNDFYQNKISISELPTFSIDKLQKIAKENNIAYIKTLYSEEEYEEHNKNNDLEEDICPGAGVCYLRLKAPENKIGDGEWEILIRKDQVNKYVDDIIGDNEYDNEEIVKELFYLQTLFHELGHALNNGPKKLIDKYENNYIKIYTQEELMATIFSLKIIDHLYGENSVGQTWARSYLREYVHKTRIRTSSLNVAGLLITASNDANEQFHKIKHILDS